jgi:fumarate hydratase class II
MPLIAHNLLGSIELLANASSALATRCVEGIMADEERIGQEVERSLALATALAPQLGYDRAAEVAKEAHRSGRTVRQVAEAWEVLPKDELDEILDPRQMTGEG